MPKLLPTISHPFSRDEQGQVAIIFAICLTPFLMALGYGVDYANASRQKNVIQNTTDATALSIASVLYSGSTVPTAASLKTQAQDRIRLSAPSASLQEIHICTAAIGGDCAAIDGTKLSVGQVYLRTSSPNPSAFDNLLANVGGNGAPLSTSSIASAGGVPTRVDFTMYGAKGYYWKQLDLYIHNPGDASDTLKGSWVYRPKNGDLTGTTTPVDGFPMPAAYPSGPGTLVQTFPSSTAKSIDLGSTYDKVYLVMTVSTDGCSLTEKPLYSSQDFSDVRCKTAYSQPTKTTGVYKLSTADSNTVNHLFRLSKGVRTQITTVPDAANMTSCGKTITYSFEDMKTFTSLSDSAWAEQDFFFGLTGTNCVVNPNSKMAPTATLLVN